MGEPFSDTDDEMLMAFADGELDAENQERVRRLAASDPATAARIELFRRTRALVGEAVGGPGEVPAALKARVEALVAAAPEAALEAADGAAAPGNVVALRPREAAPRAAWIPLALAASVAIAAGLAGYLAGLAGSRPDQGLAIARLDNPALVRALDTLPSGEASATAEGGRVAIIGSYLAASDQLCREFELDEPNRQSIVGVACRDDGRYEVTFAVLAPGSGDGGYAPASSMDALEAYVAAIGAGPMLSKEEELKRLAGR